MPDADEPQVITPTRVIPAGEALDPDTDSAPGLPPAEDAEDGHERTRTRRLRLRYRPGPADWSGGPGDTDGSDLPPWRRNPPPARPPTPVQPDAAAGHAYPPPTPVQVHARIAPDDAELIGRAVAEAMRPPEAPEPQPLWRRLGAAVLSWVISWRTALMVLVALVPITPSGHSMITVWATVLGAMRDDAGALAAGVTATTAIAVSVLLAFGPRRVRQWWAPPFALASVLGSAGALRWWDVVEIMTGVPL